MIKTLLHNSKQIYKMETIQRELLNKYQIKMLLKYSILLKLFQQIVTKIKMDLQDQTRSSAQTMPGKPIFLNDHQIQHLLHNLFINLVYSNNLTSIFNVIPINIHYKSIDMPSYSIFLYNIVYIDYLRFFIVILLNPNSKMKRMEPLNQFQYRNPANLIPRTMPCIQPLTIRYKKDHQHLPLLIMSNHHILVFSDCPIYKRIYHYLISFSEPLYRPKIMHQYKITKFSLYTAMVLHYTAQQIIQILKKLSKNLEFPKSLQQQISSYMKYAGQVKFSLIGNNYYFFVNKDVYQEIKHLVEYVDQIQVEKIQKIHLAQFQSLQRVQEDDDDDLFPEDRQLRKQRLKSKNKVKMIKCKVKQDYFQVAKLLIQSNIPIIQEYDFSNDKETKNIQIQSINGIKLRYYQERALKNIFIQGIARSGIIILPCGAGKSLVAIQVIQRIKKNAVIFCQSQVSAQQWKSQLCKWTTIDSNKIIVFSNKFKKSNPKRIEEAYVFITTYAMVGMKRVVQNQYLQVSQKISWGVCIADQVHKLPADTFQRVLKKYKFHLKIGLTATPYREDNKIDNLFYMIGPKLFEQNWLDLVNEGCLARPYCVQILCQMPAKFMEHYKRLNYSELLHTANPNKFKVLQYLIKKHSSFNDKILVFCDRPKILQLYAKKLKLPFIHGQTKQEQRIKIYNIFKTTKDINVIFLSRVGDTAIDLPCANVGIQVGMHFKSRRQQIQRMGRIMRAKDNPNNQFNAFFYTLVSMGTKELVFSRMRQKCLVDQGFPYEIVLANDLNYKGIKLNDLDQKQYLIKLLVEHEEGAKYDSTRMEPSIQNMDILQENQYYYSQDL